MSLIGLIILLLFIGLVLGFAQRSGKIDQQILNIIYFLIFCAVLFVLLRATGLMANVHDIKV